LPVGLDTVFEAGKTLLLKTRHLTRPAAAITSYAVLPLMNGIMFGA